MNKLDAELAAALAEAAAATQAEQATVEELAACKEEVAAVQQDLTQWPTAWYATGQEMHATEFTLWVTIGHMGPTTITT